MTATDLIPPPPVTLLEPGMWSTGHLLAPPWESGSAVVGRYRRPALFELLQIAKHARSTHFKVRTVSGHLAGDPIGWLPSSHARVHKVALRHQLMRAWCDYRARWLSGDLTDSRPDPTPEEKAGAWLLQYGDRAVEIWDAKRHAEGDAGPLLSRVRGLLWEAVTGAVR